MRGCHSHEGFLSIACWSLSASPTPRTRTNTRLGYGHRRQAPNSTAGHSLSKALSLHTLPTTQRDVRASGRRGTTSRHPTISPTPRYTPASSGSSLRIRPPQSPNLGSISFDSWKLGFATAVKVGFELSLLVKALRTSRLSSTVRLSVAARVRPRHVDAYLHTL